MIRGLRCIICSLLGVCFLFSCDLTDPSHLDRPPILKAYHPSNKEIKAFLGDTLSFNISAADPDGGDLQHYFMMGDSVVSNSDTWMYVVQDTGLVTVKGVATDGGKSLEISWQMERLKPINLPPVIRSFEPPDLNPVMIIGNQLDFRLLAEDPEKLPVSYFYKIADSVVSTSRHYSFLATQFGETEITAYATDGEKYGWVRWLVRVTDYPDTIPPAPVSILSLVTGVKPGELNIQWIAVGENDMEGLPSYYQLRTSRTPIIDDYSWQRASDRPGEPSPIPPGEIMAMVIRDLNPAESVYVAVRAVDEFSNISPLGDCRIAKVKGQEIYGLVRNSFTNEAIEGVRIDIGMEQAFTGPDGWFAFDALPIFTGTVFLADESNPEAYGNYFDLHFPYAVQHNDTLSLWLLPNLDLETEWYDDFLLLFRQMTDTYNNVFGNILRTWEIPFDFYIKPLVRNGLDYAETIAGVLDEYEVLTGMDLFNIVDSPPEVGVRVDYKSDLYADNYRVELKSSDLQLPIKGVITFRMSYSTEDKAIFEKIIRHEVGHSLGLKHTIERNHLMYGGVDINTSIKYLSPDEIPVLLSLYRLPRLFVVNHYKYN